MIKQADLIVKFDDASQKTLFSSQEKNKEANFMSFFNTKSDTEIHITKMTEELAGTMKKFSHTKR